MTDVRHLSIAEVVVLHAAIMERTGYTPAPLAQEGLLESAIRRTLWASLYDEDADVLSSASPKHMPSSMATSGRRSRRPMCPCASTQCSTSAIRSRWQSNSNLL